VSDSGGGGGAIGKIGLFVGHGLVLVGALIALAAFVLPWFSAGGRVYTGLETVSKALETGGDPMFFAWGLVPLGALGLLLLSFVGLAMGLFSGKPSAGLSRVLLLLPLFIALPGLCGCGPLGIFLAYSLAEVNFDFNSFSNVLAGLVYGFWVALGGLGVSFVGILIAQIGGLIARRRSAS
jgi:hypothetical protein